MITEDKDIMLKDILRGMSLDVLDDKALEGFGLMDTGVSFGRGTYKLYATDKLRVVLDQVEGGYRIKYVYEAQDQYNIPKTTQG